ncbi:uncharacterized protein LOC142163241 [Nicotiana tabacum]|uniref:Uncharacterized protein LOC142163241 n=1 Tax=Nicotiana tabacum TaxID=4097 RepID=A0AC58RV50_TOBAC
MPNVLKYNGATDPNEHITAYTCSVKGNDLKDDEIESILLKKFVETLSKGAMMRYQNLRPNLLDSFAMLEDSFVKVYASAIKVATKKSDIFKIKQRENEILREFPKLNLVEYPTVTLADVHNRYQSKIRVKDAHLGAPYGSVYPSRLLTKEQRFTERKLRPNKERHSGTMEAPRLSKYNFNIDVSGIVSAMGRIRDTRWPKPAQSDPSQRNPNLMCEYHGIHGHRTEDCRQLREDMAWLINE